MFEDKIAERVYPNGERQAVAQAPTFGDVLQGLRYATERVEVMAAQAEEVYGLLTGNFAPPCTADADKPRGIPSGVIPEFSVLLQEVHLQLGRVEKALSLIRSL